RHSSSAGDGWRHRVDLADRIDPDPARHRLRAAWLEDDRAALRAMAATDEVNRLEPPSLTLLAVILADGGDRPAAVEVLRRGLLRHPFDVRLNFDLARDLAEQGPEGRVEALGYYRVARALRPENGHELAHLLKDRGRSEEAEAIFRDLSRLSP